MPVIRVCRRKRRRVATRCDDLAANYLAFIKPASIRIWLSLRSGKISDFPKYRLTAW
jgi:hypothetical protein